MRTLLAVAGVTALLALAGCASSTPTPAPLPPISFANEAPMRLAVASVDVVTEYRSPLTDPYVEHLFPTPPSAAVEIWARDRLVPAGPDGIVLVRIKDASVTEEKLPRTQGVRGAFTQDQAARYTARLEVEIQAQIPSRATSGFTTATAERSTTVPENVTLAERDRIWHELARQLVADLNAQLSRSIPQYLPALLL